jgi:hypothetical protein
MVALIDNLAWLVIRLLLFIMAVLADFQAYLFPPVGLASKIDYLGRSISLWYIVYTPREELPEMIVQTYLLVGKFLLATLIILSIIPILDSIYG